MLGIEPRSFGRVPSTFEMSLQVLRATVFKMGSKSLIFYSISRLYLVLWISTKVVELNNLVVGHFHGMHKAGACRGVLQYLVSSTAHNKYFT